jgi:Kef-type K+ transport system membrane component KefB
MNAFTEISIILIITTIISLIIKSLKQPLVVGYILSGIVVGPYVLNILSSTEQVELFSKIGIVILLFIVGIGLNPLVIKEFGKVSFLVGLAQIIFTALISFFVVKFLGFDDTTSLFVAIALTFSSTIIVLKLLTDKGDINNFYGKISIGILLVQDLVATLLLLFLSTLANSNGLGLSEILLGLLFKTLLIALIIIIFSKYILPLIGKWFASSQELLFISSLSWGLSVAALFAALGLSIEIGALIAGVALSMSPFSYEIMSRMRPIRDFFVIMFFILLGSHLILNDIQALIYPALILSAFVLITKPLIVLIVMNLLGYKKKIGFMTGTALSQISEFSLILATLSLTYGYITQQTVTLITLIGIITIAGSSYMIIYSDKLYTGTKGFLSLFDFIRFGNKNVKNHNSDEYESVLFGYDRVGSYFTHAMEKINTKYLVVDFNPKSIEKLKQKNIEHRYGDAEDIEFLEELGLAKVKLIISSIPEYDVNMTVLRYYRKVNPSGIILLISHDVEEAKKLYLAGASYVVVPHNLGAYHAAKMVAQFGFDIEQFDVARNKHLSKIG